MNTPNKMPRPDDAHLLPRSGANSPSSHGSPCSGVFSSFPALGDEVRFQRSPTHPPELGIVRGRVFGVCAVEVVDMAGKPLRLEAGQYALTNHPDAGADTRTFNCPEWPSCGCPAGTLRVDCPGLKQRDTKE